MKEIETGDVLPMIGGPYNGKTYKVPAPFMPSTPLEMFCSGVRMEDGSCYLLDKEKCQWTYDSRKQTI